MIVTCERCATQFQLDDSRVPARGVRVRCSRCKNAFRVVPEAQRAAEQIAELSRRAREDSQEEITQDLEGDSRGNSRSRSGSRRSEGSAARAGESVHGSTGSGLDTEESDWKFNEDVSADADAPIRTREEPKPEPPPVRRGAEADDWFRGGSDAPLELDDRPWNASEEAAAAESEPQPEVESAAEREPEPEAEAPPAPMAAAEPSLDRFVEPDEPTPHASVETPATDEFDSLPSFDASEPAAQAAKAEKEPGSTDELSSDNWDQLFGDEAKAETAEDAAPVTSRKPSRRRSLSLPSFGGVGANVGRWLGHGAQALGWLVTIGLFGAGLYSGLAAQVASQAAPAAEQVGGFELAALEGRFVENAISGRLYVVSGRVRNPSSSVETFPGLEVELLDAAGLPLASERAPLHAPIPKSALREAPVTELMAMLPWIAPLAPGEERAVEGVFASLPDDAASFRVVTSRAARSAGGPLPEVELPR